MVLGLVMLMSAAQAAEVPSLVTLCQGEVMLITANGPVPAPPAPFALKAGERIQLDAGESVVVLHKGLARRSTGPSEVDPGDFEAQGEGSDDSGLSAILDRATSVQRAGASRAMAADLLLQRPLAEDELVRIPEIRWSCPQEAGGCPQSEVSIQSFPPKGEALWSGSGAGSVTPALASLPEGPLVISIDDRQVMVRGATAQRRQDLETFVAHGAAASAELGSTEQAAVRASLAWELGFGSEALWTVDEALVAAPEEAALVSMRGHLEELAGVAPAP